MKQIIKLFTIFLMIVGIVFSMSVEVKAGRTESPDLASKTGYEVAYDCGQSTVDGILHIDSNSCSLEVGDVVKVQIIYNGEKNKIGTYHGIETDIGFDNDILEYIQTTFEDDFIKTYGPDLIVDPWNEDIKAMHWRSMTYKELGGTECIGTLHFRVKKKVNATRIYLFFTTLCGAFWNNQDSIEYYQFFYDNNLSMMDDRTMQAWLESGFVVPDAEDAGKGWADILTLNIQDTANQPSSTLTLTTTPTQGTSDITVPINIEKNDGFNLLGLTLDYDPALFTYEALEIDDALKSKISLDSVYEALGSGKIKASFIALDDITDLGSFLKLKLKVKDGVSPGTNSNVGVEITQVGNKAETAMEGNGTTCAVSITGTTTGEEETPAPGDVNADKKIDLVDAVYILQNYNQVREFTNVQKTVADVDKNGTVNLVDALMIMKFFNGEITAF